MPLVVTETELEAARKAVRAQPRIGREGLAKILGCSESRARTILTRLKVAGEKTTASQPIPTEQSEINGDSWTISLPRTRICTLEQLIEQCEIDTETWDIERWVCNKWEVGAKDDLGQIQVEPLFQVKAWLKRKTPQVLAARAELEKLLDDIRARGPVYPRIRPAKSPTGNMLQISMPDAHFGKLAWGEETRWGDYDTRLAEDVFREAFSNLLLGASPYKWDRVLLVFGNDLFNADNKQSTTTRGTPQRGDSRHHKVFRVVAKLVIWCVEQALQIAPVDIVFVSGNHDEETVIYLGHVIEAWFRNSQDVSIDNSPPLRKVYRWGAVALMFVHGNLPKKKRDQYPILMATEFRKVWGDAKFCEIQQGHWHKTAMDEEYGVITRTLPSLCSADDWHAAEAHVGNQRRAESLFWNKERGLFGGTVYVVPDQAPSMSVCLGA